MKNYTYSVNEARQEIKDSIRIYMQKDENGRYILPEYRKNPFYLTGAPGIGKTEMVKQIAQELKLGFFATSVTHHTRNSMLGLPVITEQDWGKYTEYTMPDILAQIEKKQLNGEKEGILLIDEFASVSEALVAPMLAFLQSKTVGNHTLPEGWVMILCSNPPEFNETAREFDAAVMDRVRVMNIHYSKEDFLDYGEKHGLHKAVLDFVRQESGNSGYLCQRKNGGSEIVTARGWENLSDCIIGYEKMGKEISERLVYQFIKSEKMTADFCRFYRLDRTLLTKKELDSILNGKGAERCFHKVENYPYAKKIWVLQCLREAVSEKCEKRIREYEPIRQIKSLCTDWEEDMKEMIWDAELNKQDYRDNSLRYEERFATEYMCEQDNETTPGKKELLERIHNQILKVKGMNSKMCSDEMILDIMNSQVKIFEKENSREWNKTDDALSNVLKFVRLLSSVEKTKQLNLLEVFVRDINKDSSIMKFIVLSRNEEYTGAIMELNL